MLKKLLADLARLTWRSPRDAPADAATRGEIAGALRERFDRCMLADDIDGALALAEAALASTPGSYDARLLRGRAQQKLHRLDEALASFTEALRMRTDDAQVHDALGALYQELGRMPEAFAAYERALALEPGFVLARFHRAMARLLTGDFAGGWEDFELRRTNAAAVPGVAATPRWDGAALAGRRILVAREQGLGDEIMYASVLPQLMAQGGQCFLECDPRLVELFRRSFPGLTAAASISTPVDCVVDSASLPRFFRHKAEDFPRQSYLRADPAAVERWRARLDALGPGLKVGLSWTGGVRKTRRALRSLSLEQLLPLLRTPGARFVSLQYTPEARGQVDELRARHGIAIEHWQEAIDDVDQTAALVCALDQVVSVCTTVVHLCGALGRPAWVMTPVGPEWRYGLQGETMPWYKSVRLFRQSSYRDWDPVIGKVATELAKLSAAPGDADAANLVGLCQTTLGQYQEAMHWYRLAIDANPALADAHLNAAWCATLLGSREAQGHFRAWLALANPTPPAPRAGRQRLPEVTLCCVDSAYHELSAVALRASLARCEFGEALFLGDRDCDVPGVRFVPVPRVGSTAEYSNFMIHRLHEFIGTSHALVMQYDGFVLNADAWTPEYLQYDYIGPAVRFPDGRAGGIGGFSLRSRKLLAALRDEPRLRGYDARREPYAEDIAICCAYRDVLEQRHGIRFAPGDVADRFAAEAVAPTAGTFGFHSLMQLASLYQNDFRLAARPGDGLRFRLRAESALGPVSVERELELRARGDLWAKFLGAG